MEHCIRTSSGSELKCRTRFWSAASSEQFVAAQAPFAMPSISSSNRGGVRGSCFSKTHFSAASNAFGAS